jgi:hypothetical protein
VFIHGCNSNIVTNEELLKLIPMHKTLAGEDTFCETHKKAIPLQAWTGP